MKQSHHQQFATCIRGLHRLEKTIEFCGRHVLFVLFCSGAFDKSGLSGFPGLGCSSACGNCFLQSPPPNIKTPPPYPLILNTSHDSHIIVYWFFLILGGKGGASVLGEGIAGKQGQQQGGAVQSLCSSLGLWLRLLLNPLILDTRRPPRVALGLAATDEVSYTQVTRVSDSVCHLESTR